jgi:RHS repeat-associated protein
MLCLLTYLPNQANAFSMKSISISPEPVYYASLQGKEIQSKAVLTVQDDKWKTERWSEILSTNSVDNYLIFELNEKLFQKEFEGQYLGHFECNLDVLIQGFDANGEEYTEFKNIRINNYDQNPKEPTKVKEVYQFKGLHQMNITVLKMFFIAKDGIFAGEWTEEVPPIFELRGEILIDRVLNSPCSGTILGLKASADAKYLNLSWEPWLNANEYDVEWTFYDNYSELVINGIGNHNFDKAFLRNASRITTKSNVYAILLAYPTGKLLYRVRAAHYNPFGQREVTQWTDYIIPYEVSNQNANINWQTQRIFAEDGKYNQSIKFFDASLRERQVQTTSTTTNAVIVGETIYDYQGRPALKVMPAPKTDANGASLLTYNPQLSLNLNSTLTQYSADDFVRIQNGNDCNNVLSPMRTNATAKGASNYFSKDNPQRDIDENRFIPDANGYPFSVTEYTPDMTGRIRRQGGVGEQYQIGSKHETKYFYGKPSQEELDRLFGVEVGYSDHYLKNMVVDANGQASISFVDAHGRTVATALAGDEPNQVQSLSDPHRQFKELTINLLNNIKSDNTLTSTYTIIVEANSNHRVRYVLENQTFQDDCMRAANLCYDCAYDLEIKITSDDCNFQPIIRKVSNYTLNQIFDSQCNGLGFSEEVLNAVLQQGTYTIAKNLSVSQVAAEKYAKKYLAELANSSCVRTLQYYENQVRNTAQITCANTADPCSICMGSNLTAEQRAFCRANCNADCSILLQQMLADINPISGQYGLKLEGGNYVIKDAFSVFNYYGTTRPIPTGLPTTLNELVQNWQNEWAILFLPYHPEYCYLQWCENKITAFIDFEKAILANPQTTIGAATSFPLSNDPLYLELSSSERGGVNKIFDREIYQIAQSYCPNCNITIEERHKQFWNKLAALYTSQRRKAFYLKMNIASNCTLSVNAERDGKIIHIKAMERGYDELNALNADANRRNAIRNSYNGLNDPNLLSRMDIKQGKVEDLYCCYKNNPNINSLYPNFSSYINSFSSIKVTEDQIASYLRYRCISYPSCTRVGDNMDCGPRPFLPLNPMFTGECQSCGDLKTYLDTFVTNNPLPNDRGLYPVTKERLAFFIDAKLAELGSIPLRRMPDEYISFFARCLSTGTPYSAEVATFINALAARPVNTNSQTQAESVVVPSNMLSCGVYLCPKEPETCEQWRNRQITNLATIQYNRYIDELTKDFITKYTKVCLDKANANERFNDNYRCKQYHFTLYYYDQAGNLVQTVPPAGVKLLDNTQIAQVKADRVANVPQGLIPNHEMRTLYWFNSLNQSIKQQTPDAGVSLFWYDYLGRLVLSQNAQQRKDNKFSYTVFDNLGRTTEVGEFKSNGTLPNNANDNIYYSQVDAIVKQRTLNNSLASSTFGEKSQITQTFYGETQSFASTVPNFAQENLRNRVTSVTFDEAGDGTYDYATHYTYDIAGNVTTLVHDIPELESEVYTMRYAAERQMEVLDSEENIDLSNTTAPVTKTHRYKRLDYVFDLLSGKVNELRYQRGEPDQFFYRYAYDADNRLVSAQSSTTGYVWEQEAAYDYYRHGPLSKTYIGEKIQTLDYAYTLQGWIKGVNGSKLDKGLGIGNNGRDVYGYVLGYHQGDYTPIGVSMSSICPVNEESNYPNLYNGNISHILSSNRALENGNMMGYQYRYDQLNRLVGMTAQDIAVNDNSWTRDLNALRFKETVNYDPNGNILNYERNGNGHEAIDLLNYQYESGNNRLVHVKDNAASTPDFQEDVEGEENFVYDENGNLVRHSTQNFERNLEWNAYGKVKRVTQTENTLLFGYDAQQNRLKKQVTKENCSQTDYYIRDAQGNVLSVYRKGVLKECQSESFIWQEQHLYGSSRLGLAEVGRNMLGEFSAGDKFSLYKGAKRYELTNHLGNVLSVVSDELAPNGEAQVISAKDYYPFGMSMPGRSTEGGTYRYGFNGKEKDTETDLNDFGARFYAANLGRWLSIDPLAAKFPNWSPYNAMNDNPMFFIDPDGKESKDWIEKDGQFFYDNRVQDQNDAVKIYGEGSTYRPIGYNYRTSLGQNVELGDYGFFKLDGSISSSPDLAENSLAFKNPSLAMQQAQSEIEQVKGNYRYSQFIAAGIALDIATPEPTDAAWPKWVAYAITGAAAAYYINKMDEEIARIQRKAGGSQGVQYALRATAQKAYTCYKCATGTMNLAIGDVWKYGQTSLANRYSQNDLTNSNLVQDDEFFGNQVQIKVMEKVKIYSYFITNGHLPPGNKIFR